MRILRQATRLDTDPLNIISFATHERYQSNLAKTGHNFYMIQGQGVKPWEYKYAPVPAGHFLLQDLAIPSYIDVDIVLSQNKSAHFNYSIDVAKRTGAPIISLEHCLPPPNIDQGNLDRYKQHKGDVNVFISEYSRDMWGFDQDNSKVIYHGVDTSVFESRDIDRQPHVLSICNDWQNRNWCCGFNLWQQITEFPKPNGLPVKILGDNPGLSVVAKDMDELVTAYNQCGVFLNTSLASPIPSVVLEAAACGCAIVSTDNCAIPELIEHGVNGFLSNNPQELKQYCIQLLKDKDLAHVMGQRARQSVLDKFGLYDFVHNWNKMFRSLV